MPYVSILGDSISTFEGCNPEGFLVYYQGERLEQTGVKTVSDTWWARVIDHLDATFLANSSYSGSLVEGVSFPAGNSQKRVDALGTDNLSPDTIIVFMGINDYGWGGANAQAAGRGNSLPESLDLSTVEQRVASFAPLDAAERFSEAYGLMLQRIRDTYPHATVWCCTLCPGRVAGVNQSTFTYRFRGILFDAYNDTIRRCADAQGCHVADIRALELDYDAADGTHPTAQGMQQLAAMIVQTMESRGLPTSDRTNKAPSTDNLMQSSKLCQEHDCIGCAHARSTNSSWFLVCEKHPR